MGGRVAGRYGVALALASAVAPASCEPDVVEDPNGPWSEPAALEGNGEEEGTEPRVAVDEAGNAFVIWTSEADRTDVLVSRYEEGSWGEPVRFQGGSRLLSPQVAVDASGNAVAVFEVHGMTGPYDLWASRYVVGSGWSPVEVLEGTGAPTICGGVDCEVWAPKIALASNGDGFATWLQSDRVRINFWARRFSATDGWGAPVQLDSMTTVSFGGPRLAVDGQGNGVVAWATDDDAPAVYAAELSAGSGWGAPERLDAGDGMPRNARVGVSDGGQAVVAWEDAGDLFASHRGASTGWSAPVRFEESFAKASELELAVSSAGGATAVWQSEGSIWAARYAPSEGWRAPELIETPDEDAEAPRVAMDAEGGAVAVWLQKDQSFVHVWANRFRQGSGWGTAVRIDESGDRPCFAPDIALDARGFGVAAWERFVFEAQDKDIVANTLAP